MVIDKMIVLHSVNGDKFAVRKSDIKEIRKTTHTNTIGLKEEVVNVHCTSRIITVTDDFYYILNAVNGEECKHDNRK